MIETFTYDDAGRAFTGLLATPAGTPRGGLLVFHGGSGLGDHERDRIEQLAAHGFIAFAPDLFGEVFTDRARGFAVIQELAGTALLRTRATAALRALTARAEHTAAIGHCFGGLAALELARSGAELRAAVSFHGALTTHAPARPGRDPRAHALACTGADDLFCPRDQRPAFEAESDLAAGADWQHVIYGGARHGFSVPGITHPGWRVRRARGSPIMARAMRDLVDEVF